MPASASLLIMTALNTVNDLSATLAVLSARQRISSCRSDSWMGDV